MSEDSQDVIVERLRGELRTFRETCDGRFNLVEQRMDDHEAAQNETEKVLVEQRKRWDHYDGEQKAMEEVQSQRHRENQEKMDSSNRRIAVIGAVLAFFMLICAICTIIMAYRSGSSTHAHVDKQQTELPADYVRSNP